MFQYGVAIPFLLRILIRMRQTRTTLLLVLNKASILYTLSPGFQTLNYGSDEFAQTHRPTRAFRIYK